MCPSEFSVYIHNYRFDFPSGFVVGMRSFVSVGIFEEYNYIEEWFISRKCVEFSNRFVSNGFL